MKKFYKWIMNYWSKNIWESRIIIYWKDSASTPDIAGIFDVLQSQFF